MKKKKKKEWIKRDKKKQKKHEWKQMKINECEWRLNEEWKNKWKKNENK